MSRADMESVTSECQSLRAAGKLPEGLPASSGAVVNLFAMMVDHLCASEGGLMGWIELLVVVKRNYAGIYRVSHPNYDRALALTAEDELRSACTHFNTASLKRDRSIPTH